MSNKLLSPLLCVGAMSACQFPAIAKAQLPPASTIICNANVPPLAQGLPNPCNGWGPYLVGHVGSWVVAVRDVDTFPLTDTDQTVPGASNGNIRLLTRKHGCAGTYDSIAEIRAVGLLESEGTVGPINLSGSKRWFGGFCETETCVCNPNAHSWGFKYSVTATLAMQMDFGNNIPFSSGSANASGESKIDVPFGISPIRVWASYAGSEGSSHVSGRAEWQDGFNGSVTVETEIGSDDWALDVPPALGSHPGQSKRGCGFIGEDFTIQSTLSTSGGIQTNATRSFTRATTQIGNSTSMYVIPIGDSICLDPTGVNIGRKLNDGTPLRTFLEDLAMSRYPHALRAEILYAAGVYGEEIDYYVSLIQHDPQDLEKFYESIDCDLVGIASLEDFLIENAVLAQDVR